MEEGTTGVRGWEDLVNDVLLNIFQTFSILEVTSGIGHICSSWRSACCNPLLWETLDLSMFKSSSMRLPFLPYVYMDGPSDDKLACVLKICLSLSRGNIRTLIFNINAYVSNDLLAYTAERCPTPRRLVLPAWNRKNLSGICNAIRSWKDLESITMPCFANRQLLMEKITQNCRNFRELKVMGPFDINFASTLSTYLQKLKVLRLRCSKLYKEALICVLDGLPNLEVLNITHCVMIERARPNELEIAMAKLDESILKKASRLREFLICINDSCVIWQRTKNFEGLMRWWYGGYEENIWQAHQADGVHSLTI